MGLEDLPSDRCNLNYQHHHGGGGKKERNKFKHCSRDSGHSSVLCSRRSAPRTSPRTPGPLREKQSLFLATGRRVERKHPDSGAQRAGLALGRASPEVGDAHMRSPRLGESAVTRGPGEDHIRSHQNATTIEVSHPDDSCMGIAFAHAAF
ncbi:hypothetical protein EYF80_025268 [Liparis tanakae]|uniref:Uncharacterized protein n=1 Tax=Liparis tanakae TaxID=230148 RepID=A0A4Z2HG57_9TELE|nr:hypothetical protein EYF80_025268 [Liparis tanakae]